MLQGINSIFNWYQLVFKIQSNLSMGIEFWFILRNYRVFSSHLVRILTRQSFPSSNELMFRTEQTYARKKKKMMEIYMRHSYEKVRWWAYKIQVISSVFFFSIDGKLYRAQYKYTHHVKIRLN